MYARLVRKKIKPISVYFKARSASSLLSCIHLLRNIFGAILKKILLFVAGQFRNSGIHENMCRFPHNFVILSKDFSFQLRQKHR